MVYQPAEDSFLLQSVLNGIKPFGNMKALDMGTGTGIQGLTLARNGWEVTCSDISDEALETAKNEFQRNGLEAKFIKSDLFEKITGKFSLISFNLPYLPESREEYKGKSELEMKEGFLEKFLTQSKDHLYSKGRIFLLFSSLSGDVEFLIREAGYSYKITAKQHIFFEDLFVAEITQS